MWTLLWQCDFNLWRLLTTNRLTTILSIECKTIWIFIRICLFQQLLLSFEQHIKRWIYTKVWRWYWIRWCWARFFWWWQNTAIANVLWVFFWEGENHFFNSFTVFFCTIYCFSFIFLNKINILWIFYWLFCLNVSFWNKKDGTLVFTSKRIKSIANDNSFSFRS